MSTTDPTTPGSPPRPRRLVIRDVGVLDATGREPEGRGDVLVEDGVIARVGRGGTGGRGGLGPVQGAVVIDGAGCAPLPGLMDAHVHFALIGPKGDHGSDTWIGHVLSVARVIEGALDEGFTTVRDTAGLEPARARAVAAGQLRGTRILPSGSAISQTGGHADDWQCHEAERAGITIPGLVAGHVVADGIDEVRRAAREQLRRGATQIKLWPRAASSARRTPSTPCSSRARRSPWPWRWRVAGAATSWRTATPRPPLTWPSGPASAPSSTPRCWSRRRLARMAAAGAFMVPTLQTMEVLAAHPDRMGLALEKVARLREVAAAAYRSVAVARDVGVSIASGSDVVGPWQGQRGEELVYKARVLGAHDAIISATRTNAELFGLADRVGTVEEDKQADLILVRGEPLSDISLLADPANVVVVLGEGVVVKDVEGRVDR